MPRKKHWAVIHKPTGKHIEFFTYPIQANKYIEKRLSNSTAFQPKYLP